MGIKILPPDINEGEGDFSVSGDAIRYGLSAIKGLGKPVIDAIISEREERGRFTDLQSLAERLSGKEINKRTIESFIKAGALDSLPGTRREKMEVYGDILDSVNKSKKNDFAGQMSLFDIAGDDVKESFTYKMPNLGEYDKERLLDLEKEVMGIYVSGHPLEGYRGLLEKNVTAVSSDFLALEEGEEEPEGRPHDGDFVTIGGIIEDVNTKLTRSNQMMAFVTIEDLYGSVEVIVFPRDFEKNRRALSVGAKVLLQGKYSAEDEKDSKLICQNIVAFDEIPREVWLKFKDKAAYDAVYDRLYDILHNSDGKNEVVIYLETEKAIKRLGPHLSVYIDEVLMASVIDLIGEKNVKIVEKSIDNNRKKV